MTRVASIIGAVGLLALAASAMGTASPPDDGLEQSTPDGRWRFGHSASPNRTDPRPNRTAHLGWNTTDIGTPLDPAEPSWRATWEAYYEKNDGGPYLLEWHIQGTDPVLGNLRPLSVAVDRTNWDSLGVLVNGRFQVHDGSEKVLDMVEATGRWNIYLGWYPTQLGATLVGEVQGVPLLSARASNRYVDVLRLNGADELEIGNRAERLRFLALAKPTVTTCEELGEALDAMGLVDWQPAP